MIGVCFAFIVSLAGCGGGGSGRFVKNKDTESILIAKKTVPEKPKKDKKGGGGSGRKLER